MAGSRPGLAASRRKSVARPKVIIAFPAYRAEGTLARTVADIPAGVADKLILVDDASPDGTVPLARKLGIEVHVHAENRGYGGNQKTCYTEALRENADIVVLLHPDYQYDPKAVPLLIAPILAGDADMTFGSRFAGLGDPLGGGMPLYRYVGNRVTTTLENLMLGSRFTDMHSGMRAYTRRCLLSLPFLRYSDAFDFDSQMLIDAVTSGQRVVEVPIPTRYTIESSSISIGRSLHYIGASLAYCARKTLVRGRRGRRSPVTERGQTDLVSSAPALQPKIVDAYPRVVDQTHLEEPGRRELSERIADALAGYALPGRRLLEVGSGAGLFLSIASERDWQARGVEPSARAVEQGRARFGVDLRLGAIEDLDEPPGSADAVVMLDTIEHLTDPLACLRRLRTIVTEEGILVLSTASLAGRRARAAERVAWLDRSRPSSFSPQTLATMLRRAGFRMVEYSTVPRSLRFSYAAEQAARSRGSALIRRTRAGATGPKVPLGWPGDIVFVAARPDLPA